MEAFLIFIYIKDAIAYQEYEHELEQFVKAVDPLLDAAAVDVR